MCIDTEYEIEYSTTKREKENLGTPTTNQVQDFIFSKCKHWYINIVNIVIKQVNNDNLFVFYLS